MITLFHGDCLKEMSNIPDVSVDMILADLPYGTTACKWDNVIPFEPLWEHYWRVLKPSGAVVLFGSEPFSSHLRMSQIKHYKYDWVWVKNRHSNFFNAKTEPKRVTETVCVFYKKKPTYIPSFIEFAKDTQRQSKWIKGTPKRDDSSQYTNVKMIEDMPMRKGALPINVLNYRLEQNNQYKKNVFHPTQKPVSLLEYLIKTYTIEGETVLDNTMGSGSTGVACVNTGRKFIGIEQDAKYFEIAKERIEKAQEKLF